MKTTPFSSHPGLGRAVGPRPIFKCLVAIVTGALLTVCCPAQSNLSAVGARDKSGIPIGEFRIVDAQGRTLAQGRFQHGRMHGTWLFFDSRNVRIAAISYANGNASGDYKTYFGSHFDPSAAGKPESAGCIDHGSIVGEHVGFQPDGTVFSRATLNATGVLKVTIGTKEMAEKLAQTDFRFIQTLETMVRDAVK